MDVQSGTLQQSFPPSNSTFKCCESSTQISSGRPDLFYESMEVDNLQHFYHFANNRGNYLFLKYVLLLRFLYKSKIYWFML